MEDLNILRLVLDRTGKVTESSNLSINQYSSNNLVRIEYDYTDDYPDMVAMTFRKPDGFVSDKCVFTNEVDEDGTRYAALNLPKTVTTFKMGGRNAILSGNIYVYKGETEYTYGNIRINVNYVDDGLFPTEYTQAEIQSTHAKITNVENSINNIKRGDTIVGRAYGDESGNNIKKTYTTFGYVDGEISALDLKKADKGSITDQTDAINLLKQNVDINADNITHLTNRYTVLGGLVDKGLTETREDIAEIQVAKVDVDTYNKHLTAQTEVDKFLQTQIDNIQKGNQLVKDIVQDKSELDAYDKTKLEDGDRILVLVDATHKNEAYIYRFNQAGNKFDPVGPYQSGSYSKSESNSLLSGLRAEVPNSLKTSNNSVAMYRDNTKISGDVKFKTVNGESIFGTGNIQQVIDTELSTSSKNPVENRKITSALNTKASVNDLTGVSNRVSNIEKDYIDSVDLESALSGKQNVLTPGANIKIENGVISVTSQLKFQPVEELPSVGESYIIYLLKVNNGYTEYIWVDDSKWESLGDAGIDLSKYYTSTQIDDFLALKADDNKLNALSNVVASNTVDISNKADRDTVNTEIGAINTSITGLQQAVSTKAEASDLENYAPKADYALVEQLPDMSKYQEKLQSKYNIKSINGESLLGMGDLLIADTTVVDLEKYVLKENYDVDMSKKANTEDIITDYNDLENLPPLGEYALTNDVNLLIQASETTAGATYRKIADSYTKEQVYTKSEVDTLIENVDIRDQIDEKLNPYATQTWVVNKGYMTVNDARNEFADKTDIPVVPTKVSEFDNDKKYQTEEDVDAVVQRILGAAPDAYDTLKEVADYIESDKSVGKTLTADVGQNKTNISALQTLTTTLKNTTDLHAGKIKALEDHQGSTVLFRDWTTEA